jgi:hypothetical protein
MVTVTAELRADVTATAAGDTKRAETDSKRMLQEVHKPANVTTGAPSAINEEQNTETSTKLT